MAIHPMLASLNSKNSVFTLHCDSPEETLRTMPNILFDIVYLDPPFNTGLTFFHSINAANGVVQFIDCLPHHIWRKLIQTTVSNSWRSLKQDGILLIHIDQKNHHNIKNYINICVGENAFAADIALHGRWDSSGRYHHPGFHNYVLVYAKNASKIAEIQRFVYETDWNKILRRVIPQNEWTGYPTQKPISIIHTMFSIKKSKQLNVIDPFLGSGTSAFAASKFQTVFVGGDKNPRAIWLSIFRLLFSAYPVINKVSIICCESSFDQVREADKLPPEVIELLGGGARNQKSARLCLEQLNAQQCTRPRYTAFAEMEETTTQLTLKLRGALREDQEWWITQERRQPRKAHCTISMLESGAVHVLKHAASE